VQAEQHKHPKNPDMSGDDEASSESKLNIANYFIMSAPTGEVADVVTDVTKLVGDNKVLTEEALTNIMHNYNCDQLNFGNDPNSDKLVIVSQYNQIDKDHYLDPTSNKVLKYDHRKMKFLDSNDSKSTLDDSVAIFRTAAQKALDTYVEGTYKSGKAAASVFGDNDGKLTIVISAKNVHLGNFWTGSWRSVFGVSVGSSGSAELKGNIKVNVHYFEDGNVQLHTNTDKAANITIGSEENTAAEIIKALGKIENDFQSQLEDMYVKMHSTTFKSMRRFFPVTRQPMTWNINAHSLANDIAKS